MILVLNKDISPQQDARLTAYLEGLGLTATRQLCQGKTILLLSGQTDRADTGILSSLPMVESVLPLADPLPLASRRSHPADTVVQVGDVFVGGGHFCLMAGPCTVESEEQLLSIARSVQAAGAQLLRGGAYKPRTSPYSFSGLREEGLALLRTARRETGLPVVSEIMSATDLPLFEDVDILQVGARNMQNYDLLRALGRCRKPVLLCRHGAGAASQCRVHSLRRQRKRHSLRAGHPHLQRRHPQHLGSLRRSPAPRADPPARHRRSQPCRGPCLPGAAHGPGRRRLRV